MASSSAIDADPEQARLAALRSYRLMDTPPEAIFDSLVQRAASHCNAPVAGLALVDEKRCWFKARFGIERTEIERHLSFSDHAFRFAGIFVIPDATKDPRFSHLPIVANEGFRFFAGSPLISSGGFALGTLCVLDRHARNLSPSEAAALKMLTSETMDLFEKRRAENRAATGSTPPMGAKAELTGKRGLLIVDDDDAVRSFVCVASRKLGYQVMEAANGIEALKQLDENPDKIALVLTDVNMPLMDGVELVKALKKRSIVTPVAVMSGRFDNYIRTALHAEGVTALLSKPFSTESLKQTLLKAIGARA